MAGDWISGNFVDATRNATDVYRPQFHIWNGRYKPFTTYIYICKYTLSLYIYMCVYVCMQCNAMQWNAMEWNGMEWNGMEWYVRTYGHTYVCI